MQEVGTILGHQSGTEAHVLFHVNGKPTLASIFVHIYTCTRWGDKWGSPFNLLLSSLSYLSRGQAPLA